MAQANQTKNDQVLGTGDESTIVPVREEFPPAVNLLRNSSFEEDNNGAPRQWNYQYDSNSGNTMTTLEAIRTGAKGLKVVGGGSGNFGLSQPAAKEIERRDYAFSVWVKPVNTDAHTVKLSFWDEVNNREAKSKTFSFSGTKEWSRLVFQISNKNTWNGKKWFPMITVNGLAKGALYRGRPIGRSQFIHSVSLSLVGELLNLTYLFSATDQSKLTLTAISIRRSTGLGDWEQAPTNSPN